MLFSCCFCCFYPLLFKHSERFIALIDLQMIRSALASEEAALDEDLAKTQTQIHELERARTRVYPSAYPHGPPERRLAKLGQAALPGGGTAMQPRATHAHKAYVVSLLKRFPSRVDGLSELLFPRGVSAPWLSSR